MAAIVTYNRAVLLERCIDAIRAQDRPPEHLLIINNSSTDETVAMLGRKGVDFVTQPNLGSAGGWARAIDEALAGEFDAVWLMDDDGYPDPAALDILAGSLGATASCVSSVVLREDQPTHFVFPFPWLNARALPVLFAWRRKMARLDQLEAVSHGPLYPFAHLFNGALVRTSAARTVGNVALDYFMFGDEVDYFLRLRQYGPVYSDLRARHYHPDVTTRPLPPQKVYYFIKNTIILNNRFFDRAWIRNFCCLAIAMKRVASRNSWREMLTYIAGSRAPLFWRAIIRGWRGQRGCDFDG